MASRTVTVPAHRFNAARGDFTQILAPDVHRAGDLTIRIIHEHQAPARQRWSIDDWHVFWNAIALSIMGLVLAPIPIAVLIVTISIVAR